MTRYLNRLKQYIQNVSFKQKRPKNLTDLIYYPTIDITDAFIKNTSNIFKPSTTLCF